MSHLLKVTILMTMFNCKEVQASPNFSLHAWSKKVNSQNVIIVLTTIVVFGSSKTLFSIKVLSF